MTIKANGTRVRIRSFREGPKHDPYSCSVITVWRHGNEYEFEASALRGVFVRVNDVEVLSDFEGGPCEKRFEQLTGASAGQWEQWADRLYIEDPYGSLGDYE